MRVEVSSESKDLSLAFRCFLSSGSFLLSSFLPHLAHLPSRSCVNSDVGVRYLSRLSSSVTIFTIAVILFLHSIPRFWLLGVMALLGFGQGLPSVLDLQKRVSKGRSSPFSLWMGIRGSEYDFAKKK
jgi:hypothetical protein